MYANRLERGSDALAALDRGLSDGREFLAGADYSVADIALYVYMLDCADDAGADLGPHGQIRTWLERVEGDPRLRERPRAAARRTRCRGRSSSLVLFGPSLAATRRTRVADGCSITGARGSAERAWLP